MVNIIKAGWGEEVGLKKHTSEVFEVPGSALKNKVKGKETNIEKLINTRLGWKPVLPYNFKDEFVSYCLMMELKCFGVTRSITRMAFGLAIKNSLAHPLLLQQGRAGWRWKRKFMWRHPRLWLLKPQVTSAARIKGSTKINFAKFFRNI
jgi:hypothetical protein